MFLCNQTQFIFALVGFLLILSYGCSGSIVAGGSAQINMEGGVGTEASDSSAGTAGSSAGDAAGKSGDTSGMGGGGTNTGGTGGTVLENEGGRSDASSTIVSGTGGNLDSPPPVITNSEGVALTPSRTSGVAPLSVFFDAEGTTRANSAYAFHDIHYYWDFGDRQSGIWSVTGRSKNRSFGPVASHVFETPGTYTVTLSVVGPQDSFDVGVGETVDIVVDDPDQVFSGDRTVCFSSNSNFEGCPSGATTVTTENLSELQSHIASGRRLLLRRNDSWSISNGFTINVPGPGTIGTFSEGNAPRITINSQDSVFILSGQEPNCEDWRIMDLDIRGTNDQARGVDLEGTANNVLALRLNIKDVSYGFIADSSTLNYHNANGYPGHDYHDGFAIVDCRVSHMVGGSGGNGALISGRRMTVMGNHFDDSTSAEHNLRVTYLAKAVLSNNEMSRPAPTKLTFKLHAPGFNDPGIGQGLYSEQVVLSDNIMRGADENNGWLVTVGPQNNDQSTCDERLRDFLIERNWFIFGAETVTGLVIYARRITVRNNVFNTTRSESGTCIALGQGNLDAAVQTSDIWVYNNTCYTGTGSAPLLVEMGPTASDVDVVSNLVAADGSGTGVFVSGLGQGFHEEQNIFGTGSDFIGGDFSQWQSFQLTQSSRAVDKGSNNFRIFYDFAGNRRPVDGDSSGSSEIDCGAFEYQP